MEEPGADQVYIAIQILDIDEVNEQQMVGDQGIRSSLLCTYAMPSMGHMTHYT